jgi:hypothetical protein
VINLADLVILGRWMKRVALLLMRLLIDPICYFFLVRIVGKNSKVR